jgi:hypothetical protein
MSNSDEERNYLNFEFINIKLKYYLEPIIKINVKIYPMNQKSLKYYD